VFQKAKLHSSNGYTVYISRLFSDVSELHVRVAFQFQKIYAIAMHCFKFP